jgi:tryptophanyl-tRNA synthetase
MSIVRPPNPPTYSKLEGLFLIFSPPLDYLKIFYDILLESVPYVILCFQKGTTMRVVSGIQPTGTIHLGNYFGALKHWVDLQNKGHECFYFIVNQHAITMPQDPKALATSTLEVAAVLLAVGLDPAKSTIYVQSDVPQHAQLAWVLNCLAPMGQMERMIQYKEKSQDDPGSASLGLFAYPVLQSADILLFKANLVPVGIDQAQHLELTRILAEKFNSSFKELFPLPKTLHTEVTKVVGLDGSAKMSKSKNNYLGLVEDEKVLWEKLRVAATDPARVTRKDPGNPFICNIYSLHKLFSDNNMLNWVVDGCQSAKIGCIDCKQGLFKNINAALSPIRAAYHEWMQKPDELRHILHEGARKAQKEAQKTLDEVYQAIGFNY